MTQKFTILNQKQRNYLEVRPLCIMWETSIIFVCVCVWVWVRLRCQQGKRYERYHLIK